ncbi:CocE/NonD family hydrolase [Saxibacter everestensis]|uniref:CocE/NonD family hydrolase n=1 Tax=Saxibacter everestensis TaxID=2909229 RepID=A0ABY8QRB9_9MICO|nr:CocE/NonD family hydrolase [Brevibacteriaceae bacterium ZFBP1038]
MSTFSAESSHARSNPVAEPRAIRVLRHVWIPLSDGTRLSARIWLPQDAEEHPVPAVLEYIPYRKNDMTAGRDNTIHPVFAQAGYAAIRVDMRGCGDSDGTMADEYAQSELDDGLEILSWIAGQSWSDGGVGIIGKSWGGFNGLQIAALRPPELRAIITICSTDDRYADDVHFNGGVIIGSEMLSWASTMFAYNARPADPRIVGESWREQWHRRMNEPPYIDTWLQHQRRDDYWKHASVCEDYSAIEVPVLAVGGLYDEYRTTLFRLLDNLNAPTQALLGPWAHNYPHQGNPGPAIDFLPEAVRWWDRWMKGIDNGVAEQPRLRAFIPNSARPGKDIAERPGRWIAEQQWPSNNIADARFSLSEATRNGSPTMSSTESIGSAAGSWLQFGEVAGQQTDQREDDAESFTATWPELESPLEFVGTPAVNLTLRSDTPRGLVAVRLCDVGPDGTSRLVTAGMFNLTHAESHEHPEPLEPGSRFAVRIPLLASGHRFLEGHRVRVSISASYWPWAWPTPEETKVTLDLAVDDGLLLPVRQNSDDSYTQDEFRAPTPPPPNPIQVDGVPMTRTLATNLVTGETDLVLNNEARQHDSQDGLVYYTWDQDRYLRTAGDPLSAVAECRRVEHFSRPAVPGAPTPNAPSEISQAEASAGWDAKLCTFSRMTGDKDFFFITNELVAYEGDQQVFSRSWSTTIPRDLN